MQTDETKQRAARVTARVTQKATRLLEEHGIDYVLYATYSGRGMYSEQSSFAFAARVSSESDLGVRLRAMGLTVDSLGYDWVYYLR